MLFGLRSVARLGLLAGVAGLMFAVVACGGNDDDEPEVPGTIEIVGVDYAFQGVPQTVPVGTTVNFRNGSDVEFHELVAIRLPDGEDRPVSELIQLSEEELGEIAETMPAMVLVAMPGEEGKVVLGSTTFTEAGRYALLCFIPLGADPEAMMEEMEGATEGPPEVEGGPPHAFEGMVGEIRVQ